MKKIKKVLFAILLCYVIFFFTGGKFEHISYSQDLYNCLSGVQRDNEITFYIVYYSEMKKIDPFFLSGLIYAESRYKRNAVHYNYVKGKLDSIDVGCAQLNSRWFGEIRDVRENIDIATDLISALKKTVISHENILHSYNQGLHGFTRGARAERIYISNALNHKKYLEHKYKKWACK